MDKKKDVALLETNSIYKSFNTVKALQNISIDFYSGEIFCLLGDNGAGKSTYIKVLSGVFKPDRGEILFNGRKVIFKSPRDSLNMGIMTVYQDLAIFPLMSVRRNFIVGSEPTIGWGPFRILNFSYINNITNKSLERVGINLDDVSRSLNTLSGGERQTVAIARSAQLGAKMLILDEPTAALGVKEAKIVLDYTKVCANTGIAIIFITHNIAHALAVGDRFGILNHGKLVGIYDKSEVDELKLFDLMSGKIESKI
jgi:simple sugar transport system ATP-binding protein